jgi:uncharacterized protein YbaR (Trm112 family)
MKPELVDLLRCPVSKAPVRLATLEELREINRLALEGKLVTRGGTRIREAFGECLVCDETKACYPIRDGLPVMLVDESFAFTIHGERRQTASEEDYSR